MSDMIRGKPVRDANERPTPVQGIELNPSWSLVDRGDHIERTWTSVRSPREAQVATVKAEAGRRIFDRFPQWKQANMTARGVELQEAWRENGAWTETEAADAEALKATWAWIKAVRVASNTIEAASEVALDYADQKHWPE